MSNINDLVNKDLSKPIPKDSSAYREHTAKGKVAERHGELEEALMHYEAAVRLDKDNSEAQRTYNLIVNYK